MIDYTLIEKKLLEFGYESARGNTKTMPFVHPMSGSTLFLKVNTKHQPLVVHPDFQRLYSKLSSVNGVHCEKPMHFYHNSTMRAFPERVNTGQNPTKYGLAFGFETIASLQDFLAMLHSSIVANLLDDLAEIDSFDLATSERMSLMKSRIGQGTFRDRLIEEFDGTCPLTGIDIPELLVASHIVPWSACKTVSERMDPNNGLLLSANVDALFDKGFISFEDNGLVLVSPRISPTEIGKFGLNEQASINLRNSDRMRYMSIHREAVFQS